jgi:general secretion pathway protein D
MEVHQKVEDVIGESFEGAVETSKREARTMITVKDSQTAVIGGLIRERKDKIIHKVPILGDIPILGIPFTRKSDQNIKTNLLIFICPHILDSEDKLSSITEKKRAEVRSAVNSHDEDQSSKSASSLSKKASPLNSPVKHSRSEWKRYL